MKWLCLYLLLLLGCNKVKKVEANKIAILDSTKYDGMYLGYNHEVAGTYHNEYFLLTICHYTRYDNYKDWWIARYTEKDEKYYKRKVNCENIVYYEIINLSAAFKPKKLGKLYYHDFNFKDGEQVIYKSDTTENGFHFEVVRKPLSYSENNDGLKLKRTVNTPFDHIYCQNQDCFHGNYRTVSSVPYRIITDEEINSPETKLKNEEFMKSIKKL